MLRIVTIILAIICFNSTSFSQDTLPWGKTKEPSLITPDERSDYLPPSRRYNPQPSEERSYTPRREYEPDERRSTRTYRERDYVEPRPYQKRRDPYAERYEDPRDKETFSNNEILATGHKFFGKVSKGLAKVIAHAFSQSGRPNGYILGEEAGGAFVAGLSYGEGTLFTKNFSSYKVYWQGPSIGYDFGAEGSKTMVLVYDLRRPSDIYRTFTGVNGSAYFVGGVGITYQRKGHVVLARIRSGVGVRLGANIGYLKYTRRPTWNPF